MWSVRNVVRWWLEAWRAVDLSLMDRNRGNGHHRCFNNPFERKERTPQICATFFSHLLPTHSLAFSRSVKMLHWDVVIC